MSVDAKTSEPVDSLFETSNVHVNNNGSRHGGGGGRGDGRDETCIATSRNAEKERRNLPPTLLDVITGPVTSKLSSRRPMPMETEGSARGGPTDNVLRVLPRKGFATDRWPGIRHLSPSGR
ncbi:uncharacterized protein LOC112639870 [Camponotus floridanus]|uniref:uncharacterized protein LOC112639870 n=1 Tax=Camponotus floridanus TaxID=104421 RepID=UPI000DC684D8|nr:uncharacterized protein LOC112639870 [Camponotus floridanus]